MPASVPGWGALGLTPVRLAGLALLALVYLVALPVWFAGSNYILGVLTNASISSFIALGVWVTFAIGRINISQGAFALIGGYTVGILSTRYGVSFWLCLPLAGLVAAAIGTIIGSAILRLRGVYFAMITLSLTEAVRLAFLNGGEFTQGASGIVNIPRPDALEIFGLTIIPAFRGADPLPYYYLAAALLILGLLAVWRLTTSRLGWVFRSMRQNEELAASIGINVAKYRVIAYGFSCFLGGVGGAFFAAFHQNIYPATYSVTDSVNFMLYCFLGGLDFVFGPVVGAFLLVISFELLHDLQQYQALIYGVLMISCILWLPNGILSLTFRRDRADDQEEELVEPAAGPPAAGPSDERRGSPM
jgi:branched-chain amino acid transport system permease protein